MMLRIIVSLLLLLLRSTTSTQAKKATAAIQYRNMQRGDLEAAASLCRSCFDLSGDFGVELEKRYDSLVRVVLSIHTLGTTGTTFHQYMIYVLMWR